MSEPAADMALALAAFKRSLTQGAAGGDALAGESLSATQLAWLALPPVWLESVVVLGFPGEWSHSSPRSALARGPEALALFERLVATGRLQRVVGEAPWNEGSWYLLPDTQRAFAFETALRTTTGGVSTLHRELTLLVQHLLNIEREVPNGFPPVLKQFIEMFSGADPRRLGAGLDAAVLRAIERARESGSAFAPAARELIDMADPLARVFGGELQVALARARRRLELFERRAHDERSLTNYTKRPKLERAFVDFLDRANDSWALHYIGGGGMGKTMLMRRITTTLAREYNLVTSRIDFDHINPDYPARAPGLLLMALAEDLKLDDSDSVEYLLERFSASIAAAHRELEGAVRGHSQASSAVGARVSEAESLFIEVLAVIADRSRVVLILDTCEELARVRPNGDLPDSVVKTFELLERLHRAVPSLRVVFSGRRPLARRGLGWEVDRQQLPERPYLLRCEVNAFDEEEAHGFLAAYRQQGRQVDQRWWPEVLRLCAMEPGFNPYDLNLYASWLTAKADSSQDAPVDPVALLQGGAHFYVRERIVRRVADVVRPWLPYLVYLRHFDRTLLAEVTGKSGPAFEATLQEITCQEWIQAEWGAQWQLSQAGPAKALETWRVDENIRVRLARYYLDEEPAVWESAAARLRERLPGLILSRPWSQLTLDYFEVACLLLLATPTVGYAWWRGVEEKISRDRAWLWGMEIVERLFVALDHDASGKTPNILRAAVLATNAALRTKLGMKPSLLARRRFDGDAPSTYWMRALMSAGPGDGSLEFRQLYYRSCAGIAGAYRWRQPPLMEEQFDEHFAGLLDPVCAPGTLEDSHYPAIETAMLENLTETLESVEWRNFAPRPLVQKIIARIDADLGLLRLPYSLFARMFRVRLQRLADLEGPDMTWLGQFEPGSAEWAGLESLDWTPPEAPATRLVLEGWRTGWSRSAPMMPDSLWRESLRLQREGAPLESLDHDRLLAAQCLRTADSQLPEDADDALIEASLRLNAQAVPQCCAHREIPPLFVVALEVRADHGRITEVVTRCHEIIQNTGLPLDVRQEVERLLLRLTVKWRLGDMGIGRQTSLETSARLADRLLLGAAAAFDSSRPPYAGRWVAALEAAREKDPRAEIRWGDVAELHIQLDWAEAWDRVLLETLRSNPPRLGKSLHPDYDDALGLRELALKGSPWPVVTRVRRGLAGLALGEGSLLALRQPELALVLLDLAAANYGDCGDVVGRFLALNTKVLALRQSGRDPNRAIADVRAAFDACSATNAVPRSLATSDLGRRPDIESPIFAWWPWLLRFHFAVSGSLPDPGVGDSQEAGSQLDSLGVTSREPGPDLRRALLGGTASVSTGKPVTSPRPRDWTSWLRTGLLRAVSPYFRFFLFGAGLGLGAWSLYSLTHWLLKLGGEDNATPLYTLGVLAEVVVACAVFVAVMRPYLAWLQSMTGLRYWIARVASPTVFELREQARTLFDGKQPYRMSDFALPLPLTEESYADRAKREASRTPAQRDRGQWILRTVGALVNIELVIPDDCAAEPWEAIFALRGYSTRFGQTRYRFRRTSDPTDLRSTRPDLFGGIGKPFTNGPMVVRTLFSGRDDATVFRDAWLRVILNQDRYFSYQSEAESQSSSPQANFSGRVGVLHLVAEVSESERGLSIRPREGRELLAAEIARQFPDLRLVILQLPTRREVRRFKHDCLQAARARTFAAQLFSAGAQAVLVIPSLTAKISLDALKPLIETIAKRPGDATMALMVATRRMQEVIATELRAEAISRGHIDPVSQLEVPFDVCLYCRSNVSLRVRPQETP